MTWAKLDDQMPDHPKIVEAGPLASWLNICGICYCSRYLTDGFIPAGQVRRLADVDDPMGLAARLVTLGLWEAADGGYRVHDYLGCGVAPETLEERRETWERLRPRIQSVIYNRDDSRCRYCGATDDLTIDHVVPLALGGSNRESNLITACRSCNSRKGARMLGGWQR